MEYIKQQFNIKDLEVLSGIKAHTIRIWEKRYNVLKPKRTETNIRYYDEAALQRLLNLAFLNDNGYKISRIANLSVQEIDSLIHQISSTTQQEDNALKAFKLAMLNFDTSLFAETYHTLLKTKNFREVFQEVFIPLLQEIGTLWQTNTIQPAHEHFVSHLIRQKIYLNISTLPQITYKNEKVFVLFLPENEIHDLGLLFLHYELLSYGFQVIYLGHSLPISDLLYLEKQFEQIFYISYLTVKPDNVNDYIHAIYEKVLSKNTSEYWIIGNRVKEVSTASLPARVKAFNTIPQLIKAL